MKTDNLLLYGGIGLAAYMLLFKKKTTTAIYSSLPGGQAGYNTGVYYQPPQQNNTGAALVSAAAGLVPVIANLFGPKPTPAVTPVVVPYQPTYDYTTNQPVLPADNMYQGSTASSFAPQSYDEMFGEYAYMSGPRIGCDQAAKLGLY